MKSSDYLLVVVLAVLTALSPSRAETNVAPLAVSFLDDARQLQLTGYLYRPDGTGPSLGVDPRFARMPDAYAAKSFLVSQPFVDGGRIALMGWSHGGATTLFAVDDIYLAGIRC